MFSACYSCAGKVVTVNILGDCTRCNTTQKMASCKQRYTARLDLQDDNTLKTVTVFSPIMEDIYGPTVTKASLLTSEPSLFRFLTMLNPPLVETLLTLYVCTTWQSMYPQ